MEEKINKTGSAVRNPPAMQEPAGDTGLIPGSGRSPGEGHGNTLQHSCLENPMDRGAWWATVHRIIKSQTQLPDWVHTHTHMPSPELGTAGKKEVGQVQWVRAHTGISAPSSPTSPCRSPDWEAGSCKIEFSAAQPLGWHQSHGWPLSFKQWQVIKIELPNLQGGEPGPNLHHNIFSFAMKHCQVCWKLI